MREIRKVAVIGAGVMGAGIAAQVANAGIPVRLLDIVPRERPAGASRSAIAEGAVARLLKTDPAPLMHPRFAGRITPGNLEDDLASLADCDWIIEAVVENLEIKRDLYQRLETVRKPGSVVSSNTSTIPLARLLDGLPETFVRDFVITHFFNPPRYMRLMELVASPASCSEAVAAIRNFADHRLGKTVVDAKDTPGFIANRIGVYWLQAAVVEALDLGLTVEEADAVVGKPMGIPKTGVFGLLDLVGLDLMPHVLDSMLRHLPADDPLRPLVRDDVATLVQGLIAQGCTGRKGKGGFYRLNREGGGKVKEAVDLATGAYRRERKAALESLSAARAAGRKGLKALVAHPDRGGRYAWRVLADTLSYAAALVPEIADSIAAVDEGMRLGYNWKFGPFELIDQLGAAAFAARLQEEGRALPPLLAALLATHGPDARFYRVDDGVLHQFGPDGAYHPLVRPEGVLRLEDVKRRSAPLARNTSASLWDLGDGVVCLEFTSKMNSLDPDVMAMIQTAIPLVRERYKALVIANEGGNFSVGANLGLALFVANIGLWEEIGKLVQAGQQTYAALRAAPFPVVGAPSGMALGGGCEILLHCDAVQAHAETYIGLVEVGVGLIPGWGGCKEMLRRWQAAPHLPRGPMPAVARVFEIVSTATVAKSAAEARDLLYLRPDDGITMNRDRLLADAKARALALAENYAPPEPATYVLPGPSGQAALALAVDNFRKLGRATPHDAVVAAALAAVLSGGDADPARPPLNEADILALEHRHFMALVRHPDTLARIEHMLETGRPLRN